MLDIDGTAGGGQIVRSALSLSILTDTPIRIEDVRGNRPNPGLKHQHCSAVELVADICDADVTGADLGSTTLTVDPGTVSGGRYEASIGTAGSITLVFDTLLPLAPLLDEPLSVTVDGGTDVKWSPPLDYYRRVKFPFLRQHGLQAAVEPGPRGFYPAGGGEATLRLGPCTLGPIRSTERGERRDVRIYSVASEHLDESNVAPRQATAAMDELPEHASVVERVSTVATAQSPGSVVVVVGSYEDGRAGVSALGERGTPAEEVGTAAAAKLREFERSGGVVDEHLADQVLLPLAVAGGELAIPAVTDHVESSIELLETFGVDVLLEQEDEAPAVTVPDPITNRDSGK